MRGTKMPTYTVTIAGPGALADRFEQVLDVLPDAAMTGGAESSVVTLYFDVRARTPDRAVERAFHRAQPVLRDADVTFDVCRSSQIAGREPWWRRRLVRA